MKAKIRKNECWIKGLNITSVVCLPGALLFAKAPTIL